MWRAKSKTASRLALEIFHEISSRFTDFAFDPENRCVASLSSALSGCNP
jgi:hypothetical protein